MTDHMLNALSSTRQDEKILGRDDMIKNSDGAYVFARDPWTNLRSFLVLGTEGGSFYASERDLTKQNIEWMLKLIAEDPFRFLAEVKDVSQEGLNIKQNTPLFAYALYLAKTSDSYHKHIGYNYFPDLIRTGSQLLTFFYYYKALTDGKGSGNGLKKAVSAWYNSNQAEFQMTKYRTRSGWSHGDVLKLIRPTPVDINHATLFAWATGKEVLSPSETILLPNVSMFEALKSLADDSLVGFIEGSEKPIPWEFLPTDALSNTQVWKALYKKGMAYSALIRNLGNASSKDTFKNSHALVNNVAGQIKSERNIALSRIHPFQILNALATYGTGRGFRGNLYWTPEPEILAALEDAYYLSFGNVESTGKRRLVALDVSGSMDGNIIANSALNARQASVALSIMTAAIDPGTVFVGFSGGLTRLHFNRRTSLNEALMVTSRLPFQHTDISLPMRWAMKEHLEFDSFEIYTDNETNAYGMPQPMEALNRYRKARNIPAKLITVGMVSNGFTVADPKDVNTMDVVGFDVSAVQAVSAFIKGV